MAKKLEKPTLERVLRKALANAGDVVEYARDELLDKLGNLYQQGTDYNTLIAVSRDILSQFAPAAAQVLSDAQIASWVLGVDELVRRLPAELTDDMARTTLVPPRAPVPLPPGATPPRDPPKGRDDLEDGDQPIVTLPIIDDAVKDIISRQVVTRKAFDAMQDEAKRNAFTVAWQESEDTIEVIRDAVGKATQEGWPLAKFREELKDQLGTAPMSTWHSELVFRQNVQQGYANGKEKIASHPIVKPIFPFAMHAAIHDGRVRPTHLSLEKTGLEGTAIYWADDPMWEIFTSPIEWQCRCNKRYLSVRQAAKLGLKLAQEWLETGIEPEHESRLPFITWRPDPAFVGGRRAI